jgi:predicted Zn-dependent protease with MMP-like domain
MVEVSDQEFQKLIDQALDSLPKEHTDRLQNVAILYEHVPTPEQRQKLALRRDQTLFGLYEGVPLAQRQGITKLYPDKITLFIYPLCASVNTVKELKEQIRHTLWHEIAHYYGLNHDQIHDLE